MSSQPEEQPEDQAFDRLEHLAETGLGHLLDWYRAVELQAERILNHSTGDLQARSDAYLFVLAVRQIHRAAMLIRQNYDGPQQQWVAEAIDDFDAAVPSAKTARDILDHFDDYASGRGDLSFPGVRRKDRFASDAAAGEFELEIVRDSPDLYELRFGPIHIEVGTALAAAKKLVRKINETVFDPADPDAAIESLGEHDLHNPVYVATAFFSILAGDDDLDDRARQALAARVDPDASAAWGDFNRARQAVVGHSLASRPIMNGDEIVYIKLIPDPGYVGQVSAERLYVPNMQFITLRRRSDIGDQWFVRAVGPRWSPDAE